MSIKLTAAAWTRDFTPPQQLVMQALGDHANDDGSRVFPGIARIASKTGYCERQVLRIVAELRKLGALILVSPATRSRAAEYRIDLSVQPVKPAFWGDKMSPNQTDEMTSCQVIGGDQVTSCQAKEPDEVTFHPGSGDISSRAIRKNHHEPSRSKPFRLTPDREANSEPVDARHGPIRQLIQELHLNKFRVVSTWDVREGKALSDLLAANPRWTEQQLGAMVRNRFDSEAVKSERPAGWISSLGSFAGGALDRYGRTKAEGNGNGHGELSAEQIYERECAIIRARA